MGHLARCVGTKPSLLSRAGAGKQGRRLRNRRHHTGARKNYCAVSLLLRRLRRWRNTRPSRPPDWPMAPLVGVANRAAPAGTATSTFSTNGVSLVVAGCFTENCFTEMLSE